MINNYNSLGSGRDTWSKNDVGEVIGSPPNSPNKALTKSWLSCIMMMLLFLSGISSFAQTTLINPLTDGGFENGATPLLNGWTTVNAATQSFFVGSVAGVTLGSNAAYTSTTSATFTGSSSTAVSHIYKDVFIPIGQSILDISFKYKTLAVDASFDFLKVFVVPTSTVPVADIQLATGQVGTILGYNGTTAYVSSQISTSTIAGTTQRIVFSYRQSGGAPLGAAALDEISVISIAPAAFTAVQGGLWSSTATWSSGIVPGPGNDVTIPAGVIITVDQALSYRDLTVNGILQWGGTFAGVFSGNVLIGATGKLLPYSTVGTGQALTVGGNFQNDGYANLALATLTFNGSGSTLSGSGIFQGDGTRGLIRNLFFTNTGSYSITTSQNLTVTAGLVQTAGSLNTNGKLAIDNTAQVYGQPLNLQVANIAVTAMGSLYTVAPVVFGVAVTQWSAITGVNNTLYVSGNNVYRCTTAASLGATAPTHTSGIVNNLLYIAPVGTLGNPFQLTSVTVGTQYFYGGNLYTCTATGTPLSSAPPVHTTGTALSGAAAQFLYVGTPATATVNYDGVTQTVRSLNLTSAGSGYSSAPSAAFSVGVLAGTGSAASASSVYLQQVAGVANSQFQKSGGSATVSGGLTINSDQGTSVATTNPQASSGVGAISSPSGGVNYTVGPTIGFSLPTALNLVVNTGSGYTSVPTVTLIGGNLVSGTAATLAVTVNNGTIESVYASGTGTYSVLPTFNITGGGGSGATFAFPVGCLPTAVAVLGSNGQITNYNVTNPGFGYVATPIVGIGTTTATANGGTFTTVAGTPTARIGLYNLTLNTFLPLAVAAAATNLDDAAIPTNRKINTLAVGNVSAGLTLTSGLTLFGTAPLTLTASATPQGSVIDMGGNNLNFTWNNYTGTTATFGTTNAYVKNGSMTFNSRGGLTTLNVPFASQLTWNSGTTPTVANSGSSVTKVTFTETAAPSNASVGTGVAFGNKAYNVAFGQIGNPPAFNPVTGTNPTVTLSFNSSDGLTGNQDELFVADATALSGAWTTRSTAFGASGAVPATGFKATATVAPGPIVPTMSSFYAFAKNAPTVTSVLPLTVCANSGTFTITGTNLTGVTAVIIGGTAVSSFTVVNATTITGIAGNGTDGVVAVTKNGAVILGTETVTVSPSPAAPSLSSSTASINLGGNVNVTATGGAGTFNWFNAATGGTLLFTGATFNQGACGNIWVSENNGSCDGARAMVTVTVAPTVVSSSIPYFCGTGSSTTLSVSPVDPNITYTWSSLTPSATLATSVGSSVSATITQTSNFQVVATTPAGCITTSFISVGVYALPTATVTTTANGVCPGTSATIGSGLSAGNFSVISVPYAASTAPATAGVIMQNGVAVTPLSGGSMDDGGWSGIPIGFNFNYFGTNFSTLSAGTNGLLMFGAVPGYGTGAGQLGQFTFTGPTFFPNATNPGNIIALMAADLHAGTNTVDGSIKYWTEGYAPNRTFVIEYRNVNQFSANPKTTVQCRLFETLGTVEIHILEKSFTASAIVGLQDATKTIGAVAPGRSGGTWTVLPAAPEAWRFSPPANYTTVWSKTDTSGTSVIPTAPTNVFSLTVTPLETTTYSISYTNTTTGCSNAPGSASVLMTVLGTVAPIGVNTLAATNPICAGGTTSLSLSYAGLVDGIVFQWQQSIDGGANFTNIAAANGLTLTVAPTVDTQYRVSMISCLGTPAFSTPVAITFTNNILTTTPATRCGTGAITLAATANSGANVVWYAAASGGTALFTGATYPIASLATTTTFYAAAETNGPLCSSVRVPVVATVTPAPALTLSVNTATICTGFSTLPVTITNGAPSYNTYDWSPSIGVSGNEVSGWVFNPTISTVYILTATETAGAQCSTTATLNVTVNAANVTTAVSASTICLGLTSTLTATSTALSSGSSILPGIYCVADSSGGAGSTPIATVAINTLSTTTGTPVAPYSIIHPAIGAETTTLTSGQTYPLTVTSTGATIASVWFDWNRDGVYGATEWTQLWTSATSGTINVTVPANAVAGATGMRVRTRGAGNSSVNTDGCTAYFSGTSEDFTVNVIGSTDATASYTYGWTSVPAGFTASTSSITVTPTLTTAYTVTATNPATGCITTDTKTVTVNTDPVANITGGSSTLCIGGATADFDSVSAGIIWTATPTGIVTIDVNSGLTTAVAVGTVTINASVFNPTTGCTTFALNPQTVTVGAPVVITSQPINQNILVGDNTSFTVTTTGTVTSYQWKVSTDGGVVYNNVPVSVNYTGANTSVLNIINAPASFTSYIYQCLVTATGSCPSPVISSNAILSVENISISGPSPLINTICSSGSANFTATLSGPAPDAIIWELFDTPTSSWTTLDPLAIGTFGSIVWTGETTNSLTLNGVSLLNNGWKVRATAVLNDPLTIVTTNEGLITVNSPAVITASPSNQTVCYSGATTTFSGTATGSTGFQWEYSDTANPWANVVDGIPSGTTYSGATTATLNVTTTALTSALGDKNYRLVAKSPTSCPDAVSNVAQLLINTPVVTANASLPFICNLGVTPVTLTAAGAVTYSWSPASTLSASTGAVVTANPTITTTYTVTGTDALGCAISASVTVLVGNPVAATVTATPAIVCPGTNSQLLASLPVLTNTVADYTFAKSTDSYTPLVGATALPAFGSLDDSFTPLQNIGFNFNYEGNSLSDFSMSTNGYLRLGALVSGTDYTAIDGSDTNVIAFNNRDMNNAGAVYSYLVTGTAPNRICKIEAKNFYRYNIPAHTGNAQVWLYETSGKIEMRYGAYAQTWSSGFGIGTTQIGLSGAGSVRTVAGTTWAGLTNASIGNIATASVTQETTNQVVNGTVFGFSPPIISTYTYAWSPSTYIAGQESLANPVATNVTADITYTVVVTSNIGCSNTYTTSLSVQSGVAITTQPVSTPACQGTIANFSVVAAGAGITYQWRKNGVAIAGNASASSANLALPNVTVADNGSYDVVATPLCGAAATSSPAILTVNPTPVVSTILTPLNVCVGGPATTAVLLTGTPSGVTFNISGGAAIGLANVTNVTAIPSFTTIAGTATISVTPVANGCLGTPSIVVYTVKALPNVFSLTPASSVSCSNAPAVLINTVEVIPPASNIGGCLTGALGLYPAATATATTCNGIAVTNASPADGWAGEYSNVNVVAGNKYVFSSTIATDYITIGNSANTLILAAGQTPLTYYATTTAVVRFYTYSNALCGEETVNRTRSFVCSPAQNYVFTPSAGLFTDAAGLVAYTGTAVIQVYAKPATTTIYNATATNGGGCTRTATTTITSVTASTWFVDADGDGFGNAIAASILACAQPVGYVANSTDCDDTLPGVNPAQIVKTQLRAYQCGTTLGAIGYSIYADVVSGATGYRFIVKNMTTLATQTIDKTVHVFALTQLPSYDYGTAYSINVLVKKSNNVWLGDCSTATCIINTPLLTSPSGGSQLSGSSCGATLANVGSTIYANTVANATGYQFRVTNNVTNATEVFTRTLHWFTLASLTTGGQYGTSYTVEVAVKTTGLFGAYGNSCTVTTPPAPALLAGSCGGVATNRSTAFYCPNFNGVSVYRFQLYNPITFVTQTIDRPANWFNFSQFPGFALNTVYEVRISVKSGTAFSPLGAMCTVTSPIAVARGEFAETDETITVDQDFKVIALPNPFTSNFGLDMKSFNESNVNIQIYDMIGKLLESRDVQYNDVYNQSIGERYPSGVYNVIVSQGENVKTLRVIKQ